MPVSERDWARGLSAEKAENSVEGLDEYELNLTADGYSIDRANPEPTLGIVDVVFWIVLLVAARYLA